MVKYFENNVISAVIKLGSLPFRTTFKKENFPNTQITGHPKLASQRYLSVYI